MLRRRGPPRGLSAAPIDLALEARDPRMASDVVFQFLAFRCVRWRGMAARMAASRGASAVTIVFYSANASISPHLLPPSPPYQAPRHTERPRQRAVPLLHLPVLPLCADHHRDGLLGAAKPGAAAAGAGARRGGGRQRGARGRGGTGPNHCQLDTHPRDKPPAQEGGRREGGNGGLSAPWLLTLHTGEGVADNAYCPANHVAPCHLCMTNPAPPPFRCEHQVCGGRNSGRRAIWPDRAAGSL